MKKKLNDLIDKFLDFLCNPSGDLISGGSDGDDEGGSLMYMIIVIVIGAIVFRLLEKFGVLTPWSLF